MVKLEIEKWSDRVLDGQITSTVEKMAVETDVDKKALMQSYLEKLELEQKKRSTGK